MRAPSRRCVCVRVRDACLKHRWSRRRWVGGGGGGCRLRRCVRGAWWPPPRHIGLGEASRRSVNSEDCRRRLQRQQRATGLPFPNVAARRQICAGRRSWASLLPLVLLLGRCCCRAVARGGVWDRRAWPREPGAAAASFRPQSVRSRAGAVALGRLRRRGAPGGRGTRTSRPPAALTRRNWLIAPHCGLSALSVVPRSSVAPARGQLGARLRGPGSCPGRFLSARTLEVAVPCADWKIMTSSTVPYSPNSVLISSSPAVLETLAKNSCGSGCATAAGGGCVWAAGARRVGQRQAQPPLKSRAAAALGRRGLLPEWHCCVPTDDAPMLPPGWWAATPPALARTWRSSCWFC